MGTFGWVGTGVGMGKMGTFGNEGVIPSFRPCFADKCDPQSRDLTQFPSGYNFAVKSS